MPSVLVLSAVLLLCAWGAVRAADEAAAMQEPPGPVVVEAVGLAPMPLGSAIPDVRRDALLDARRNAVIQAHVIVQEQDRVQGMRLEESLVRSQALGYVEQMEVWEEGPVAGSEPPVYRVRVRARVRPLETFSVQAALGQNRRDAWQPALALSIEGNAAAQDRDRARTTLLDALHRCGIVVQERSGPALALRVSVTADPKAGHFVVADWELSAGTDASGPGGPAPAGVYVGHWQVDTEGDGADSWRRMGLMIAQDAVRLWNTPRWTTVRFLKPTEAQAQALVHSLGQATDARVTSAEDRSTLTVELPIAGDPVVAVDAFVRQAGLSRDVELDESSLTQLTYRCLPAPRPAAQGTGR